MRQTTLRDYKTWLAWLDDQWYVPSLTDHYLMEIAQSIWQVNVKDPTKVKLDQFRLKRLIRGQDDLTEEEVKQQLEWKLGMWMGVLGGAKGKSNVDFSKVKLMSWEERAAA